MPDDKVKKVEKKKEDKQNPKKIDDETKQVSEFEKMNYLIQIILQH